jgi:Arc/MetJ-type ribon-helix-helix transcriptional regulator
MAQFVTRIDDGLAGEVDRLVSDGIVASRSAAVRLALQRLVELERRAAIGRAIVEGYERVPQTEEELRWADAAAREMFADEPW